VDPGWVDHPWLGPRPRPQRRRLVRRRAHRIALRASGPSRRCPGKHGILPAADWASRHRASSGQTARPTRPAAL